MKKILYLFLFLISNYIVAQQGYKHLNFTSGINLEGNSVHTLSFEINKGNLNAWDISVEAHLSDFNAIKTIKLDEEGLEFWEAIDSRFKVNDSIAEIPFIKKEELFQAAVYYKPKLINHKNLMLHFRYGGGIGRASSTFLLSGGAGFELSYTLPGQFAFFIQQHNQYFININNRFRHSLLLGVKIPL